MSPRGNWNLNDLDALAAMVERGASPIITARILGRTVGAVERLAREVGPAPDRRCPVCGTRLAAYNPGPRCYAHEGRAE